MRILANFIYVIFFMVLAIGAMFLGGVAGVTGAFYTMVVAGNTQENLITVISILSLLWLLFMVLRYVNKKAIKRNRMKQQQKKQAEEDTKKHNKQANNA